MALFGLQFSRRVQVGLIFAAVVLAGILTYRSMSGESTLSDEVNFVCVATGKTYQIDRDQVTSIPVASPDGGQATLVPCVRREGKLFVDPHYRSVLDGLAEVNQYVDAETLAVKSGP